MLHAAPHAVSPTINIPHQSGTFVTIDEVTLIHQKHPESILYQGIALGVVYSMGLDKCIHHYNIIQSIFTALKILCALPTHFSPPIPFPGNR